MKNDTMNYSSLYIQISLKNVIIKKRDEGKDYFLPPFLSFDLFSTAASLPFLAGASYAMRIFHLPPS
ncbi:hypothetical protein [Methanocalculus sp. MC3]